jgi:hypothetical protein
MSKIIVFEILCISPYKIYVFIKSLTDTVDEPLKIDIDPSDGELRFFTALQTIIDDTDIPLDIRQQAEAMYDSEFLRHC